MVNVEIKADMKKANIPQWKLADKIGVCEMTIIRWFRKELPQDKRSIVLTALSELKNETALY